MDLLKFEVRSFVAGGAIVAMLWAFAHACALERAPDPDRESVNRIAKPSTDSQDRQVDDAGRAREAPAKRVGDGEDVLEGD